MLKRTARGQIHRVTPTAPLLHFECGHSPVDRLEVSGKQVSPISGPLPDGGKFGESKDWLRMLNAELSPGEREIGRRGGLPIDMDLETSRLRIAAGQACDPFTECAVRPPDQTCSRALAVDRSAGSPRAVKHLPAPEGPREALRTAQQGWITKRHAVRFEPYGRRLGNLPCS